MWILLLLSFNLSAQEYIAIDVKDFESISLPRLAYSCICSADIDGDNDVDLFISGENLRGKSESFLYINNGKDKFTIDGRSSITAVRNGTADFEDVDNDGDADLLVTGFNNSINYPSNVYVTTLYLNDGQGRFAATDNFETMYETSVGFTDFDLDGDRDVIISGTTGTANVCKLYVNEGDGDFVASTDIAIHGCDRGAIAIADVNADGCEDFFITGRKERGRAESEAGLYINNCEGNYAVAESEVFVGVYQSKARFADLDADGDQDLLVIGLEGKQPRTMLYENDGSGKFSHSSSHSFDDIHNGDIVIRDLDDDGKLDIMLSGHLEKRVPYCETFLNKGNLQFEKYSDYSLERQGSSTIHFIDLNYDNLDDIIMTGTSTVNNETKIYLKAK